MLLHDKIKGYRVILASGSPRRKELLAGMDVVFETADGYPTDESFSPEEDFEQVAEMLALRKNERFPLPLSKNDLLITADTTVITCGEILGKPDTEDDAVRMLRKLSGVEHSVVTGVAIRTVDKWVSFSVATKVKFREITEEEIAYYVTTYRPMDKAGAYGIQEWIGYAAIERVEGSYFNVVGLPVQRLYVELMKML